MVHFVKVFSLAVALGLSLLPGHHQPAAGTSPAPSHQLSIGVVEGPQPAVTLDGTTSRTWTAVQARLQAEIDAENLSARAEAQEAADAVAKWGARDEYLRFENSTRQKNANGVGAFEFIDDACEGRGGFENGSYLDAHTRESPYFDAQAPGILPVHG